MQVDVPSFKPASPPANMQAKCDRENTAGPLRCAARMERIRKARGMRFDLLRQRPRANKARANMDILAAHIKWHSFDDAADKWTEMAQTQYMDVFYADFENDQLTTLLEAILQRAQDGVLPCNDKVIWNLGILARAAVRHETWRAKEMAQYTIADAALSVPAEFEFAPVVCSLVSELFVKHVAKVGYIKVYEPSVTPLAFHERAVAQVLEALSTGTWKDIPGFPEAVRDVALTIMSAEKPDQDEHDLCAAQRERLVTGIQALV